MRQIFSAEDKVLPFPLYGMIIRVPAGWRVRDAMYPNRIDLDSPSGHIKIWFKDCTDNDEVIAEKAARLKSYENRISSSSATRLTLANADHSVGSCDNVVYLEYVDTANNSEGTCNWFSMVYSTREVQIALVRGDLADAQVKLDFDTLIESLEFREREGGEPSLSLGSPVPQQEKNVTSNLNGMQQFHDDAAEGRLSEIMQSLQRGVDINSRNPSGGTALMIAAKRGHLHMVKALLGAGADPNIALYNVTYRALHTAAQEGHQEIVVELLEHGAEIDAATQYGETALMSAAYYGRSPMVELLLRRGADSSRVDREGNTASDWARRMGHHSSARILSGTDTKRGLLSRLYSLFR